MNSQEAKAILAFYRPGADEHDPQFAAALEQVRRDPELQRWFEAHCRQYSALRQKFREIPVPEGLKARILKENKIIHPQPWWQKPSYWAAAAAVILLVSVGLHLLRPRVPDRFEDYRSRMVKTALREYRMDIVTNDLNQIRQYLATKGGPSDYVIPKALENLSVTGGGLLRWRAHPVSMVCFDRGVNQMIFLFVLDRAAVKDAPPSVPEVLQVNKLATASWTQGDKTYLLAGETELQSIRQYW